MSTIALTITPPGGSPTDYTSACVFERSSFGTSFNAAPGSFDILIRDPNRTLSFATGSEIALTIDGVLMFGGYVLQVSMTHFAPAADTANLSTYNLRTWNLRGSDYNIIFDKRVWRDDSSPPGSYLVSIPLTSHFDGAQLIQAVDNFADLSDFDSSGIDSAADTIVPYTLEQGVVLRNFFVTMSFFGGCVFYVSPAKVFIYVPFEAVTKSWGFSDQPNGTTTVGFREVEAVEDASFIENDVLIWGGSEFAGTGKTVFDRDEDSTSESTYGRWQYGETHFGETGFKTQAGVEARADVILFGPPGADIYGQQKGLRYSQWQFTFTWFSSDVPGNDHLVAGDIVQIDMNTFGVSKLLPMRSLRISFPDALEGDTTHQVQFDGVFGLQVSDPFTLWAYLLKQKVRAETIQVSPAAVTDASTNSTYGAIYQGTPTPATDGATTVFTLPLGSGTQSYIPSSLQIFMGTIGTLGAGLLVSGTDFTESDPDAGEFTMTSAPANTKFLYATCLCAPSTG